MSTSGGNSRGAAGAVSYAAPQALTGAQQQQAATNIGTVLLVETEQFAGADDGARLTAAINALLPTGGTIRLRPGKNYVWPTALGPFDFSTYGLPIFIDAWGATITCTTAAGTPAITVKQSAAAASTRTLTVRGGTWINPTGDFWLAQDMGKMLFYRCEGNTPAGAFIHQSNVAHFSERNSFIGINDNNCLNALKFTIDGSPSASMARTVVRDLKLQNGTSGNAKIYIGDGTALYGSLFDGVSGNVTDGVIVYRLAGNLNGTIFQGNHDVEDSTGPGQGSWFTVGVIGVNWGTLLSPIRVPASMVLMDPGSSQPSLFQALNLGWGVLGVGTSTSTFLGAAIPMTTNTETAVFTLNLTPGIYKIDCAINMNATTASTAGNAQARVNGGTATYTMTGKQSDEVGTMTNGTATNQTATCVISCTVTVTVAGTVIITARMSQAGNVANTTPSSGYIRSTGVNVLQVA